VGQDREIFVIGGGPSGLAAAIAASQRGFKVTVADGNRPPIDKACGEGLMPDAVLALQQLGVHFSSEEGHCFRGISFLNKAETAAAAQSDTAQAEFPIHPAIGIRRTTLHKKMVEAAESCGVQFLWNTPVTGLTQAGVLLGRNLIRARWIIGADGSLSRVRHWCGLKNNGRSCVRFAYRRHYRVRPWTDFVEVHWGPALQAYVTPVAPDEICVAVVSRNPHQRSEEWRVFPELAAHLADAPPVNTERGAITGMRRLSRVYRDNVALIGDASGTVDAITGEGLNLSFRQAFALAEALESGDLAKYQAAHRRISMRPGLMGRLLLMMDDRPLLRQRVVRILAGENDMFSRLLAAHVGESSVFQMMTTGAMFGMRLLVA